MYTSNKYIYLSDRINKLYPKIEGDESLELAHLIIDDKKWDENIPNDEIMRIVNSHNKIKNIKETIEDLDEREIDMLFNSLEKNEWFVGYINNKYF